MRRVRSGLFAVRENPLGRVDPVTSGSDYQLLQMAERQTDIPNRISDAVIYDLMLDIPELTMSSLARGGFSGFDNAAKTRAYKLAIDKFKAELPADMIRRFVDATIAKLLSDHRQMLRARAEAEAERKARRRAA